MQVNANVQGKRARGGGDILFPFSPWSFSSSSLSSPHLFFFFWSNKQRAHLSAGQGKCLSHLLQESRSPQELWRQSGGPPGPSGALLAPLPDQRRTRKKRRPLGGCPAVYPGHPPPQPCWHLVQTAALSANIFVSPPGKSPQDCGSFSHPPPPLRSLHLCVSRSLGNEIFTAAAAVGSRRRRPG